MTKEMWIALAAVVGFTALEIYNERKKKAQLERLHGDGYKVRHYRGADGSEAIRLTGSFDDIMRDLGVIEDEKPPLPDNINIDRLLSYEGGCPHCRVMSMVGENMWRYQELSRTREYMNNTTTYLARCKKCMGFMISCVDHDW